MKEGIILFLLSPMTLLAQEKPYKIEGKIDEASPQALVYITYRSDGEAFKDSVKVQDGTFKFEGTVPKITPAKLLLSHDGSSPKPFDGNVDALAVYLQGGEEIKLNAADSLKNSKITGSKLNMEYQQYSQLFDSQTQAMAAVNKDYQAANDEKKQDPDFMKSLNERYQAAAKEKQDIQTGYINKNPNSYFSLQALNDIAGFDIDIAVVEPLYKKLGAKLRKSEAGEALAKRIEAARKTAIGAIAPVFIQNDVDGNPVSLTDFRGKYVLLDFWASWCGPCRDENPNLVKAYHNYKDKNFTVLGISLDQPGKRDNWLNAIEYDGLEWTQVSDLNFWDNEVAKLYGVRGIPQNFLLDPSGKIVAKNLRGEELHQKLAEILE